MFKILISLFLLTGSGVIFFTESKNYFSDIKVLRKQELSYNETINMIKKVKSSIDKILAEYNSISQEKVDRINKIVPSGADSMKMVVQIDDMMRKNGLSLKNINTKDIAAQDSSKGVLKNNGKSAESISLSMTAQGSYESFRSFIKMLEKSLRLVDVISVRISPADKDNYSFSVEAVSYWRKTLGDKT